MGDGSNILMRYAQLDEQAHLVLHVGEVIERTQLAGKARRYCIHLTLHLVPVLIGHIGTFGYADAQRSVVVRLEEIVLHLLDGIGCMYRALL